MISFRLAGFLAAGSLSLLILGGCSSSSTTPTTPTPPPSKHMYLSLAVNTTGSLQIYTTPVTSTSVPTGSIINLDAPEELFVDTAGRLFVPFDGPTANTKVNVYTTPVASGASPAFILTTLSTGNEDVTESGAGTVYVSVVNSATCCIDIFPGPVSANATAASEITANGVTPHGLGDVYGVAFDSLGNLYASSMSSIIKLTPPISAASTPAANVTPNSNNWGLLVDASNRVFAANATVDGTVDVFTQPFQNGSARAFGLSVSAKHVTGMAFDSSGNLWCVDGNGAIWEGLAPISSTTTFTNVLTVTNAYGIAFGP